ncbi:MAG: hypothetical protein JW860_07745 [Sedimentisphaerales bacterium]|nr:hypothetical protein [Sedimentisphaerales bacterium]
MPENVSITTGQLPRLRPELVSFAQIYDGQPYWVYKDPLSLRYYRFNREEHFIIEQLHKGVTLDELKEAHHRQFSSMELSNREIGVFISSLISKNLLIMTQPHRDELMFDMAKKRRRAKFFGQITNFLFIKIPLWDPDKFFDRIMPYIRFIWSRTFFLLYLLLLAVAFGLLIARWSDVSAMYRNSFYTIYNLPILFLAFWLVKALHEFGHGLTCKNYGGEVHELGLLLLVFMPLLYCNITDSWTFASKAQRLLVTAGGILSELMVAALATVVWYFTDQPGFIHAFAFNTIFICSISTILFNANPLLRFDGYYIMMDLIEVPNLRQRAGVMMRNLFIRFILGGQTSELPEEHRFRCIFPFYAVSSFLYRWFIVFAITFTVYRILKGIHLEFFGRFFMIISISTMLFYPLARSGTMIAGQRRELGITNVRLVLILVVCGLVTGGILFWPLQQHVTLNFILEPTRTQWLRSGVEGIVRWQDNVKEGAWLNQDECIATLENYELGSKAVAIRTSIEQLEMDIDQFQQLNNDVQAGQSRQRLESLIQEEQRIQEFVDAQQVKVPFESEIITLQDEIREMGGKYVPRSAPMLLLADTREMAARVWVTEKNYARVFKSDDHLGQEARLMLYAFGSKKFKGRITGINSRPEDSMGLFGEKLALSNKVGGEVLTEYDPVAEQEKPIETVYEVTIELDKDTLADLPVRPYMSGRVRIDCGDYTLFRWGYDSLLRFISPEVRL